MWEYLRNYAVPLPDLGCICPWKASLFSQEFVQSFGGHCSWNCRRRNDIQHLHKFWASTSSPPYQIEYFKMNLLRTGTMENKFLSESKQKMLLKLSGNMEYICLFAFSFYGYCWHCSYSFNLNETGISIMFNLTTVCGTHLQEHQPLHRTSQILCKKS